jgi:DNA-binding NarL/FixJ family response regulator
LNPITVVIADDHAIMRQGLQALFREVRDIVVVGEAANGREALACVEALEPDIVVMDVSMPELNGIEATRTLRKKWPGTRVVMLSMHADAEYLFRAFEAGATGYLLKESAVDEIISAIRAVCAGQRYVGAGISPDDSPIGVPPRRASPVDSLSSRERQVLQLVVEGYTSAQIAESIHLSPKTVDSYRSRLMKKVGVKDLPALVKFAIQHGITPSR